MIGPTIFSALLLISDLTLSLERDATYHHPTYLPPPPWTLPAPAPSPHIASCSRSNRSPSPLRREGRMMLLLRPRLLSHRGAGVAPRCHGYRTQGPQRRLARTNAPPLTHGRRRRSLPVSWRSSSLLHKGSQHPTRRMILALTMPALTLMLPWYHYCMLRLHASKYLIGDHDRSGTPLTPLQAVALTLAPHALSRCP
jgi:hypothetical protein